MEDALAHYLFAYVYRKYMGVLILVLMEDALAPTMVAILRAKLKCLNPCFNGRCTRTYSLQAFVMRTYKS